MKYNGDSCLKSLYTYNLWLLGLALLFVIWNKLSNQIYTYRMYGFFTFYHMISNAYSTIFHESASSSMHKLPMYIPKVPCRLELGIQSYRTAEFFWFLTAATFWTWHLFSQFTGWEWKDHPWDHACCCIIAWWLPATKGAAGLFPSPWIETGGCISYVIAARNWAAGEGEKSVAIYAHAFLLDWLSRSATLPSSMLRCWRWIVKL